MYSTASLEAGIAQCKKSIAALELAADNERETIKSYRKMIDDLEESERVANEIQHLKDNNIEIVRD